MGLDFANRATPAIRQLSHRNLPTFSQKPGNLRVSSKTRLHYSKYFLLGFCLVGRSVERSAYYRLPQEQEKRTLSIIGQFRQPRKSADPLCCVVRSVKMKVGDKHL